MTKKLTQNAVSDRGWQWYGIYCYVGRKGDGPTMKREWLRGGSGWNRQWRHGMWAVWRWLVENRPVAAWQNVMMVAVEAVQIPNYHDSWTNNLTRCGGKARVYVQMRWWANGRQVSCRRAGVLYLWLSRRELEDSRSQLRQDWHCDSISIKGENIFL